MDKEIDKIITKLEGCFGIFDYVLTPIESNLLVSYIKELQQQCKKQKEVIDRLNFIKNRKNQGASQENINKMAIEFVNSYLKEVSK